MTTPTAPAAETIIHFTRHLAEPGCCGPPPPDPRGSEITACRHDDLVGQLRAAAPTAIADLGFVGLDGGGDDTSDPAVITDYKATRLVRALTVLNWHEVTH